MLAGADRPDRCVATTPLDGWGRLLRSRGAGRAQSSLMARGWSVRAVGERPDSSSFGSVRMAARLRVAVSGTDIFMPAPVTTIGCHEFRATARQRRGWVIVAAWPAHGPVSGVIGPGGYDL